MNDNFLLLVELSKILVSILGGGGIVYIYNALKQQFKIENTWLNFSIAALLSVLLAIGQGVVEGVLTQEDFIILNIGNTFATIFISSQAIFFTLKNRSLPPGD